MHDLEIIKLYNQGFLDLEENLDVILKHIIVINNWTSEWKNQCI